MRSISRLLIILWLPLISTALYGQNTCKVLKEPIALTYVGGCRDGLAHGMGKARGIDQYEGSFRRGLPHGRGTYTWANGDVYSGQWRNGKRHGKGTLISTINGEPVKKTGSWVNDTFLGEDGAAAFTIGHIFNLERYAVRRTGDGNRVLVNFYYMGRQGQWPADFDFKIGSGFSQREGLAMGYDGVNFPAKILITYTVPDKLGRGLAIPVRFEITINHPGQWEIRLHN